MQKIYDIIPPETGEKPEKEREVLEAEKISRPVFPKRKFRIFLICLFLFAFTLTIVLIKPKAEINVWPKTQIQSFNASVQLVQDLKTPDFSQKLIPGRVAEVERRVSQDFSASQTITKETRARGILRVYNNYSASPQTFVAQTRFISDGRKVFVTPERIVVPGKTLKNGKWEPGFVDIEVVAAAAGPEYNIPSSKFSIPGLSGTPLYAFFHAESSASMEGGSVTEVYRVSEADLREAGDKIAEKALTEIKDYLLKEIPQGWILLGETIKTELIEIFPLAKAGQEIQSFTVQAKAKGRGWMFKEEDLEEFVQNYILASLEPGREFHQPSLRVEYPSLLERIGEDQIVLDLDFSAEIYSEIDEELLKRQAAGEKIIQIQRDVLQDFPQIEKVEVKISPFWRSSAPVDIENIKVNLGFEK